LDDGQIPVDTIASKGVKPLFYRYINDRK